MKKVAALLMILGGSFMAAGIAHAYPPDSSIISVVEGSPGPVDTTFTVRVTGCQDGEQVSFTLPANNRPPVVVTCVSNTATATLVHPATPGTYTGTAELLTSGRTLSFSITTTVDPSVPSIPPTGGGEGSSMMLTIGFGAAALGAGLVFVARDRRRRPALAS